MEYGRSYNDWILRQEDPGPIADFQLYLQYCEMGLMNQEDGYEEDGVVVSDDAPIEYVDSNDNLDD